MLTSNPPPPCDDCPNWHEGFLKLLPEIENRLQTAFRYQNPEALEEATQEAICNCCLAYARLAEQGREEDATASTLTHYAVRCVRIGRQVATPMNCRDVSSRYCQWKTKVRMEPFFRWDDTQGTWEEVSIIEKGGNYQWPYKEGFANGSKPKPSTIIGVEKPPIYDYRHGSGFPFQGN